MTVRIGILEVGRPPKELQPKHPSYAQMTATWLDLIEGEIFICPIMDGCEFPDVAAADLWVITGSKCGVYEDHPWIPPLVRFIQLAKDTGKKIFGICFGHQIIAKALGGEVFKSDKGWGVGLHNYPLQPWPPKLEKPPTHFSINAYHQDQVIKAPDEAYLLGGSEFCPQAALWYPGFGISFQGHPEFDKEYEADLIKLRRSGGELDESIANVALESLKGTNTRLDWSGWIARNWQKL
jgi:GMP synthase-like glutamine amidotransferase